MGSIIWIIVISSSLWVLYDARSIGARKGLIKGFFDLSPVTWFLCCLLLWIVGFPAYLVKRTEIIKAATEATKQSDITRPQTIPSGYQTTATLSNTKTCPFCAETIKKDAILCRFCNKDLLPKQPPEIIKEALTVTGNFEESGKYHLQKSNFQQAVQDFTKALELKKSGNLLYSRAVAYSKLRETDKMKADLFAAAELGNDKAKVAIAKLSSTS